MQKAEPDFNIVNPWDIHNRKLVSHVHPPDWKNPEPAPRYNLVVIGAGTAGLVAAAGAAGLGAKVALVERHLMGGDCLNVGCVPSKAMIRAARAAAAVRDAGKFGVHAPEDVEVDFGRAMERMRRLRASIAPHDSAERFTELGVDVFTSQRRPGRLRDRSGIHDPRRGQAFVLRQGTETVRRRRRKNSAPGGIPRKRI